MGKPSRNLGGIRNPALGSSGSGATDSDKARSAAVGTAGLSRSFGCLPKVKKKFKFSSGIAPSGAGKSIARVEAGKEFSVLTAAAETCRSIVARLGATVKASIERGTPTQIPRYQKKEQQTIKSNLTRKVEQKRLRVRTLAHSGLRRTRLPPPETCRVWPLTQDPAGDASHRKALAISWGLPARPVRLSG